MNKILYVGVDMPTAVESNRNSSIMCGVFTSIRNEIRAAENSGHYACVVELQSASPHSHKNQHAAGKRTESFHFIESGEYNTTFELYKMFVKLGYRVKIQFTPNNTIEEILVISW